MIPTSCAFLTAESRSGEATGFTVSSVLASALDDLAGLATSVVAGDDGFTSSADALPPTKAIPNIASARITPHTPNFDLRIEP